MRRVPLESSVVASAGYDADRGVLEIEFASGRIYQYRSVPASVYQWLLKTPTKGAYVSRMIANRYDYLDVTPGAAEPGDIAEALRASLDALRDSPTE
jgi:hypothetical protein